MGTVSVNGTNYTVYGDLPTATAYLNAAIGPGPTQWNSLATNDLKSQYLVAATRYLERQTWDPVTASDFNTRNGLSVSGPGGSVQPFQMACFELAALFSVDTSLFHAINGGSNIEMIGTAGTHVKFFAPTTHLSGKLPQVAQELVGQYLYENVVGASQNKAYNNDDPDTDEDNQIPGDFNTQQESTFVDESQYDRDLGF